MATPTTSYKLLSTAVVTASGGVLHRITHASKTTNCEMTLALFFPKTQHTSPQPDTPLLYWLSGLTCNDTNFSQKAGPVAFRTAEEQGIVLVIPDTSPRGDAVKNADRYDLGQGAGFYLNATTEAYKDHYNMYDYITQELPTLLQTEFQLSGKFTSLTGHSMGGHGALTIAFKNPTKYVSVSAFSPICEPSGCGWGKLAFDEYLGGAEMGEEYDATRLMKKYGPFKGLDDILIEQGAADDFLEQGQLQPEKLVEAAKSVGQTITLNMREGFDHSYFFIAAFIDNHVKFHGERLNAKMASTK
eukprot:CAMPEP_0194355170 /NCGR_PEP_ID=MMETSP0174-20130528/3137_1 /TAXON_ID=216777 /ORGANISM="Proboscia alata, Strain PI-D3" /LENGTH=300 /DNA_ID=CAMNT_0039124359 /DNA_START=39 /DNA_END=941 /DNA_ORIENTATION=-